MRSESKQNEAKKSGTWNPSYMDFAEQALLATIWVDARYLGMKDLDWTAGINQWHKGKLCACQLPKFRAKIFRDGKAIPQNLKKFKQSIS